MDAQTKAQPDPREIIARDPRVAKALLYYAWKRTRSAPRAAEVTQEAIARVLEGRGFCRWNPDAKSLLDHLSDVVDSLVGNENKRASVRRRREQPMAEGDDERQPDSTPSAEQQLTAREELARQLRVRARVIERVAKDAIVIGMLKLHLDGIEGASELAALLHCAVKDIYRARERLAHHRDQALEEERREEEARMKRQGLLP